jgi:hypothetical protein
MKVYISGPMTGLPGLNFDEFNRVEQQLIKHGVDPVNPAKINPAMDADWVDCIVADILAMRDCKAIIMLKGWENSFGAKIEKLVAEKLDMQVIYD